VARLDPALPTLTNVRFRLARPGAGWESEDIYGKVLGSDQDGAVSLTRIRFTSVTDADAETIAALVEAGGTNLAATDASEGASDDGAREPRRVPPDVITLTDQFRRLGH